MLSVQDAGYTEGAERMHGKYLLELKCWMLISPDVIRSYQSKTLYDRHKMVNLYVFREKLSKSFENQVLAT